MDHGWQLVLRWSVAFWNVSAPHGVHVRTAVLLSAEIICPLPHVDCAMQLVAPAAAYSSSPHAVQAVGFSAASPRKPGLHSVTRFAVAVPAILVRALATVARTAVQDVAPGPGAKSVSAVHAVQAVGFSAASP